MEKRKQFQLIDITENLLNNLSPLEQINKQLNKFIASSEFEQVNGKTRDNLRVISSSLDKLIKSSQKINYKDLFKNKIQSIDQNKHDLTITDGFNHCGADCINFRTSSEKTFDKIIDLCYETNTPVLDQYGSVYSEIEEEYNVYIEKQYLHNDLVNLYSYKAKFKKKIKNR